MTWDNNLTPVDNITLGYAELRMNWAVDDVAKSINELMELLENNKDEATINAVSKLVRAMNNYIKTARETMEIENE